jgi:hypothetical protein
MFYEESLVSDLLKCQLCSEKLDEDSRILECMIPSTFKFFN